MLRVLIDNSNELYNELIKIRTNKATNTSKLHELAMPYYVSMLDEESEKNSFVVSEICKTIDSRLGEILNSPEEFYIWAGKVCCDVIFTLCRVEINNSFLFNSIQSNYDVSDVWEKVTEDMAFCDALKDVSFIDNMDYINNMFLGKPYYYRLAVKKYFYMLESINFIEGAFGIQDIIIKNIIADAKSLLYTNFVKSANQNVSSNTFNNSAAVQRISGDGFTSELVENYTDSLETTEILSGDKPASEVESTTKNVNISTNGVINSYASSGDVNQVNNDVAKKTITLNPDSVKKYAIIAAAVLVVLIVGISAIKKGNSKNKKNDNSSINITDVVDVDKNNSTTDVESTEEAMASTTEQVTETTTETTEVTTEEEKTSPEYDLLYNFAEKELIPRYAFCNTENVDNVEATEENWIKLQGVASAQIADFDGDDHLELLVVRFAEEDLPDYNKLMITLFYIEDGHVALGGEIPAIPFIENSISSLNEIDFKRYGFETDGSYSESIRVALADSDYFGHGIYLQYTPGVYSSGVYNHEYVYKIKDKQFYLVWTKLSSLENNFTYVFDDEGTVLNHDEYSTYSSESSRPLEYDMNTIGMESGRENTWDLFPRACTGKEVFWCELNMNYDPSTGEGPLYFKMIDYTDLRDLIH